VELLNILMYLISSVYSTFCIKAVCIVIKLPYQLMNHIGLILTPGM